MVAAWTRLGVPGEDIDVRKSTRKGKPLGAVDPIPGAGTDVEAARIRLAAPCLRGGRLLYLDTTALIVLKIPATPIAAAESPFRLQSQRNHLFDIVATNVVLDERSSKKTVSQSLCDLIVIGHLCCQWAFRDHLSLVVSSISVDPRV